MLRAEEIIELRKKNINASTSTQNAVIHKESEPTNSNEEKRQIEDYLSQIEKILATGKIKKLKSLSQAVWNPELNLAEVTLQVGSYWKKIGKRINNKLYIYPEEALYLLENGSLEITHNKVPMSIQRAYYVLLSSDSFISLKKYRVYSHLNEMGFKVLRHFSEAINAKKSVIFKTEITPQSTKKSLSNVECFEPEISYDKLKVEAPITTQNNQQKDVKQILQDLAIIHSYDGFDASYLNFDFDVYMPSKKKSSKTESGLPNFRIIVHSGCDPLPDLRDLSGLTKKFNDKVPAMNAIVFKDHISFYQIEPINLPNALEL